MTADQAALASPGARSEVGPGSLRAWVLAARPKTLTAALTPVVVGSACALRTGSLATGPLLATLGGALLLQIGANLANDVFDHEKGADTEERLGPTRAVQAGLLGAREVKRGMLLTFLLATLLGIYLAFHAGMAIVVIGIVSIVSAVAYTGGPYPLGYHGLGEVFVMIFFGPVAVAGTAFVHTLSLSRLSLFASVPIGALCTAILVVNNIRDHETDARAGKRTLAVRLGRRGALFEHQALLLLAYAVPVGLVALGEASLPCLLPLLTLPAGIRIARGVSRETGRALNLRLFHSALLLLGFGALFALGLVLGAPGSSP